ncbi:MAG: outer membrane beta-barrel protein [Desulfotignum sp.]|nr:outer membrane beta-barrel protein [Desulfotignum sp.]
MKAYHHHFIMATLLAVICLGLLTFSSASAQGRMLVKPHIQVDWRQDSNFHRSEKNEKTVHTYTVKPGVELGYTTDKTLMSLNYWLQVYKYDDQDENLAGQIDADEFDYTAHNAQARFQTQATRRLLVGVDDTFLKTRDPASADANSNAVDRFKYTLNRFSPHMTYKFGEKFGLGLKYTNLNTDYSDDAPGEGEDSVENRGTVNWYYNFTPKTSFNLDYQYWERDYDKNTVDYDSSQVMVNVKHQFNYLTFGAGAGYHNREFDKAVPSGDIDQFVWKVSVLGQNPPDAARIPKSSVYVSFGSNLNDSGTGNTYFTSTRLDARLTYLIMEKINCTLSGYYQNSEYETSSREDDRWLVSLAGDYLINEYFTVGLAGGLEERDSNQAGKDFDNEYVMIRAKFNYDLGSR